MHRILKLHGISLHNAYQVSKVQYSPRNCFFCNLCHYYTPKPFEHVQLRRLSSNINSVVLTSVGKRKAKRRIKKYVELLEVTESATNNKRAAVKNLNATQLSMLVDQPDITLDKLHKINNKLLDTHYKFQNNSLFSTLSSENSTLDPTSNLMTANIPNHDQKQKRSEKALHKSTYALLDIDKELVDNDQFVVEELQTSGIVNEVDLIKSSTLANSLRDSQDDFVVNSNERSLQSSVTVDDAEDLEEKVIESKDEDVFQEKLRNFNNLLVAYMDVFVNSNSVDVGLKVLKKYRMNAKRVSKKVPYVNDISPYNICLEKLAFNSNLPCILQILQTLRKDNISLNSQTYVYIFDCIGRMKKGNDKKLEILNQIKEEMDKDGISLNDIMTKSMFIRDQRIFVEKMVKLLDSNFKEIYEIPDLAYDCQLLKQFIDKSEVSVSTVDKNFSVEEFKRRLEKQIEMETVGHVTVRSIAKSDNSNPDNLNYWKKKVSSLEKSWEIAAINAFQKHLLGLQKQELFVWGQKAMLHPFLTILKPEDYVGIIMREAQRVAMGSETYSLPFISLCRQLGEQIYKRYEAKMKEDNGVIQKTADVYLQYCDWFIKRNDKLNCRTKWMLLVHEANKQGVTLNAEIPKWQNNIYISLGRFLYNIIANDLKIDHNYTKKKGNKDHKPCSPAFFKVFRHCGGILKEEIKPHPTVAKIYKNSQQEILTFDTTLVPSLCPPRPWISVDNGGYIVSKMDVVRLGIMDNIQKDRMRAAQNRLYPSLDSLNQLSSIPWTINTSVLDIAIKVFQNDGSVELNMPQPPSVLPPVISAAKNASSEDKRKVEKAKVELRRKKNEMYSLWCDALYRLSLANHFRNEVFWLPHNMDFRGRVYPIPPHLNHLGSDLARSMLIFAVKKPLGPNGLDWLKIHTINLTGLKKKESIKNRLKYANSIIDKIVDSAENPLTGEMWWSKSEDPWQTLASCMEIAAALKLANPEEYMTGFPVHQDGSCNGLQHYAALGRDQIGAESVNLHPSDYPQDVYSNVATMVDEMREADSKNGNEIAKILEGFITRKVVKQTVMTTVYGVTSFGAKLQIARQLKDIDHFPQEHVWAASWYLCAKTFETLRAMFKSAREIQDWFTECANLICRTRKQYVEWVTPLGLPVVQPYSKINRKSYQSRRLTNLSEVSRRPSIMKQRNAFAPNFIHSLDSSHMMLTSLHSELAGIAFVSVHDCFWTHPCSVEIMNKICREQFVDLHSQPILEDLSKFFIDRFEYKNLDEIKDKKLKADIIKLNNTISNVPKQGDFDLQGVLHSTYFFS